MRNIFCDHKYFISLFEKNGEKMNVLLIANCSSLYGANRSMLDMIEGMKGRCNFFVLLPEKGVLYNELRKRRIRNKVMYYYDNTHNKEEKSFLHILQKKIHNMRFLFKLKSDMKQWDIDIVHTNASNVSIGFWIALFYGKPHIWHIREYLKQDYGLYYDTPSIVKWEMQHSYKVICISDAIKMLFEERYRKVELHRIYNGIKADLFFLKRNFFEKELVTVLYSGVLTEEKGVIDAIKAMQCLKQKGIDNVFLKIAGSGKPDYVKKMKQYVIQKQLSDRIQFLGYQEDMNAIRKEADIAVVCSKKEALGRVTIEAMLSGLIVVGARSGATKELLAENRGYLYDVGKYEELANQIEHVLFHKGESQKRAKNAFEWAVDSFSVEEYCKSILDVYYSAGT